MNYAIRGTNTTSLLSTSDFQVRNVLCRSLYIALVTVINILSGTLVIGVLAWI